jgi:hypothetical protein
MTNRDWDDLGGRFASTFISPAVLPTGAASSNAVCWYHLMGRIFR